VSSVEARRPSVVTAVARACRLAALLFVAFGAACTDEVSLGSWGHGGAGGTAGVAAMAGGGGASGGSIGGGAGTAVGAAGTAVGGGAGTGSCVVPGVPGPPNARGVAVGTTTTNTDWFWPSALESIEWDLLIERAHTTDGYFWAHQFSFSETPVGGFIGLQMNGGYRSDPAGGYETSDMVLIWVGGPPVMAELGDIAFPDARTLLESERGLEWWTIHAKVELEPCVTYGLRFGRESTAPSGDVWYGGWLHDGSTGAETFIGRIMVPSSWGPLSGFTTEITQRIDYVPPSSCSEAEHSSALYTTPRANAGLLTPTNHTNRFDSELRCATSRFTELTGGVRHELGL
jgi:hypothetical protein